LLCAPAIKIERGEKILDDYFTSARILELIPVRETDRDPLQKKARQDSGGKQPCAPKLAPIKRGGFQKICRLAVINPNARLAGKVKIFAAGRTS